MARTVVAITGASSGIGEAFARRLAPEHDLILVARRGDRLEKLAQELTAKHGGHVEPLPADLTQEDDLARVAERLRTDPNLVLLINNAGFGTKGFFWETDLRSQEDMHKLHVMATVRLTHAALQSMVARDLGGIINVSSVAAFFRGPGSASYCSTKAWMTALTETLYLELKTSGSNVTVQALCPGFTYSEFHDKLGMNRERAAPAAWWLSAGEVVEASIEGLRRKKLFVIPGWRYRLIAGVVSVLPSRLRLLVHGYNAGRRRRALTGVGQKQL